MAGLVPKFEPLCRGSGALLFVFLRETSRLGQCIGYLWNGNYLVSAAQKPRVCAALLTSIETAGYIDGRETWLLAGRVDSYTR